MNRKKRLLSLCMTIALIITMLPVTAFSAVGASTTASSQFTDMPDNWATEALEHAVDNGLLTGADGEIMPDSNLTRAQMATVIVRAFGASVAGDLSAFADVKTSDWFADSMAKAYQMGVLKGSDGKMNPNSSITRQEVFVILARALKLQTPETMDKTFADTAEISDWAKGGVYALVNAGYIQGSNGYLDPTDSITRAQFAQVMDNIIKQYINKSGEVTEIADGSVMVNVHGVTLKNLTVNGDLIIGDGVGDGEVILDNVNISGRMVVRGGGINSVIIRGHSNVSSVVVARVDGAVSVKVEGDADVEVIYIDDGSDDVFVEGTVGSLEVKAADIVVSALDAAITSVAVSGANSKIVVSANSTVQTVTIQEGASNAKLEVSGTVSTVTTAAAGTEVTGSGTVTKVEAQAGATGSKIETPSTQIVVGAGVTGVTGGGGTEIIGGTTTQNNTSGTGTGTQTPTPGGGGGDELPSIGVSQIKAANGAAITFTSTVVDRIYVGDVSINMSNAQMPYAVYNSNTGVYTIHLTASKPLQVGGNLIRLEKNGYSNTIFSVLYSGITAANVDELEDALSEAVDGDTIILTAGKYQLDETLEINKSVKILGPKANVDPRPSEDTSRTDDSKEAILSGDKGNTDDPVSQADATSKGWLASIIKISAHYVEINGLTFEKAYDYMVYTAETDSAEDLTGIKIINNVVRCGRGNEGIKVKNTVDALVQYNYIHDIRFGGDAIEAYGVLGFRILDNDIDGCDSVNGTIRVSNEAGGTAGMIQNNIIKNTSYHFAINAEDGDGDIVIDGNVIQNANAGGIFAYKNTPQTISIINNKIDVYGTAPVTGSDYRESYLRNGASAIFVSYNASADIVQPQMEITGNTSTNGADGLPALCFGGGTTDPSAIPTDLAKISVSGNSFDKAYIKCINASGGLNAVNNIWAGVDNSKVYNISTKVSSDSIEEAVQAANESAENLHLILVPAGTYELTTTVTLSNNEINLMGAGKNNTHVNYNGSSQNAGLFSTPVNSGKNGTISFRNIGFSNVTAAVTKGNYVFISNCGTNENEACFYDCSFENFYTVAYFNNTHLAQENNNKITIKNCVISDTEWVYSVDDISLGASPISAVNVTIETNTGNSAANGKENFGVVTVRDANKKSTGSYSTIQAAIDAVYALPDPTADTIYALCIPAGIYTENLKIIQDINKSIVLLPEVADTVTLKGTIAIDGQGRSGGVEFLVIKGFRFDFSEKTGDIIYTLSSTNPKLTVGNCNYSHNIYIEDCEFIGNASQAEKSVVAVRAAASGGHFKYHFTDCSGTYLHSFAQLTSVTGVTVTDCTLRDGRSGLNLQSSTQIVISGLDFIGTEQGVRAGQANSPVTFPRVASMTISDSSLISTAVCTVDHLDNPNTAIVLRGDAPRNITIENSTIMNSNAGSYDIANTASANPEYYSFTVTNVNWGDDGMLLGGLDATLWNGIIPANKPALMEAAVDGVQEIHTAAEFAWIMSQANMFADGVTTVKLMADINLDQKPWTPSVGLIGTAANVLDGNGHTISNLNVVRASQAGLIIKSGTGIPQPTIKNLTLDGAYVEATGLNSYAGAVVSADESRGNYDNVAVVNSTIKATKYAGAISAYGSGDFTDCTVNSVTLTVQEMMKNDTEVAMPHIGGLVGLLNYGAVSGCTITDLTIEHLPVSGLELASTRIGALIGTAQGAGGDDPYGVVLGTNNTISNVTYNDAEFSTLIGLDNRTHTVANITQGTFFSTVQAAVNAAISGVTIQVEAGTYDEIVTVSGKSITLIGTDRAQTRIKAISAYSGAGNEFTLDNLTVYGNNNSGQSFAGVFISNGTVTINNCDIVAAASGTDTTKRSIETQYNNSANITIDGCSMSGYKSPYFNPSTGTLVLTNNDFNGKGPSVDTIENVTISGNANLAIGLFIGNFHLDEDYATVLSGLDAAMKDFAIYVHQNNPGAIVKLSSNGAGANSATWGSFLTEVVDGQLTITGLS